MKKFIKNILITASCASIDYIAAFNIFNKPKADMAVKYALNYHNKQKPVSTL